MNIGNVSKVKINSVFETQYNSLQSYKKSRLSLPEKAGSLIIVITFLILFRQILDYFHNLPTDFFGCFRRSRFAINTNNRFCVTLA